MFSWILTAVAIPTATQPVRKIAYAVTLEDNNSNLLHFNAATVGATRRVRTLTGLLAAIHDGIEHLPRGAENLRIRLASPLLGNSQASAARLLVRRSSTGPKGAHNHRLWAEIKGILAERTVIWKPVLLGSSDQLCAMERTCRHLLNFEPIAFPNAHCAQPPAAKACPVAQQGALSTYQEVVASPAVLRDIRACADSTIPEEFPDAA
jgi:hypothetical protein